MTYQCIFFMVDALISTNAFDFLNFKDYSDYFIQIWFLKYPLLLWCRKYVVKWAYYEHKWAHDYEAVCFKKVYNIRSKKTSNSKKSMTNQHPEFNISFFWVSRRLKFIVTSIKQQIIEIKNMNMDWKMMLRLEQKNIHKIKTRIDEENKIW